MIRSRTGASRAEIVTTIAVVALVVVAVVALWPHGGPGGGDAGSGGSAATAGEPDNDPAAADPSALGAARSAAGLAPCPSPSGPSAAGPLAGVRVPCLGAGGELDVGAALAGRPAVLNVWASWCGPCRAELPALAAYAGRPGAVPVLTVDVRDDPLAALSLLRDLGVRLPTTTDPDGAVRAALDVPPALPASYVVRGDGSVTRVDPPTPFRSADEVAAAVDRLS